MVSYFSKKYSRAFTGWFIIVVQLVIPSFDYCIFSKSTISAGYEKKWAQQKETSVCLYGTYTVGWTFYYIIHL